MKASTLVCCFSGKNTNQCIKNGSGRLEVFCEKGVLRNVAKFTENTCARVSFLIKLQASPCIFIKKDTLVQVFSCKFCKISKKTFLKNTFERMLLETLVKYTYSQWNIVVKGNSNMLEKSEYRNFLNCFLWKFSGSSKRTAVFDV